MKYRKNYHSALRWSLAALVLIIALPFVLGIANAWNESVAAQEVIAYELNNETTMGTKLYISPEPATITPFWNANGNISQLILPDNIPVNDSYIATLTWKWNLTAAQIMNMNINKIHIYISGLINTTNATTIQVYIHDTKSDAMDTLYKNPETKINNGTIKTSIKLEPALIAEYNSKYGNHSVILVSISHKQNNEIFQAGAIWNFHIFATHPHGRWTINSADFVDFVAEIYGIVFIFAAVFATGAVNPTKKHVFGGLYYGLKRYAKIRRKQKYRRARAKYYRSRQRYYRRWY